MSAAPRRTLAHHLRPPAVEGGRRETVAVVAAALTIVFAFTALPGQTHLSVPLGSYQLHVFELPLAVGALLGLPRLLRNRRAVLVLVSLLALVVVGAIFGAVAGHGLGDIVYDVRPSFHLVAAAMSLTLLSARSLRALAHVVVPVVLWVSAVLVCLDAAGVIHVATTLGAAAAEDPAIRVQSVVNPLAIAAVLWAIASRLSEPRLTRLDLVRLAPAIPILILAQARNHVVLLVIVGAVTLVLAVRRGLIASKAVLRWGLVAAACLVLLGAAVFVLPAGGPVRTAMADYAGRAFGMLVPGHASDTSMAFRLSETQHLTQSWGTSPAWGHGFGFRYKPELGLPGGFHYTYAPLYAHDYYLWLLVKVGVLGLVVVLACFAYAVCVGFSRRGSAQTAAIVLAALMIVSIVTPEPNGTPSSIVIGYLLCLCLCRSDAPLRPRGARRAASRHARRAEPTA